MRHLSVIFCFVCFLVCGIVSAQENLVVSQGKTIVFDYDLYVDGDLVESSEGVAPLSYTHGAEEIVPGLEQALEGMGIGENKSVSIKPEDAYGEVDPNSFREIAKSLLPENMPSPQVGMVLEMEDPSGASFPVVIADVKAESVVLDFNHPLAGKILSFDVTIVDIQ